jgi:acyl transferase domain-containing protein
MPTALVRVGGDSGQVSRLCAQGGVQVAVYETPRSFVLAGPSTSIRDLMRRACALGIPATLLAGGRAQHYTAAVRCTAPLRAVLADTVFETPLRRLVSSVTGLPVTPADDVAELLAGQPARPVLFAQAVAAAVQRPGRPQADLIVVTGPAADPASPLTRLAERHTGSTWDAGAASNPDPADDAGQPPATLAAIAAAATGLPAITLPPATHHRPPRPPLAGPLAPAFRWAPARWGATRRWRGRSPRCSRPGRSGI